MELGHPRHNTRARILKHDDVETYKPPSGLQYLLDVAMSQSDRVGNVVLNRRRNRQVGTYKAEDKKPQGNKRRYNQEGITQRGNLQPSKIQSREVRIRTKTNDSRRLKQNRRRKTERENESTTKTIQEEDATTESKRNKHSA